MQNVRDSPKKIRAGFVTVLYQGRYTFEPLAHGILASRKQANG